MAVDVELQDLHLPLVVEDGVVVGRGAADQHVAPSRGVLHRPGGLELPHPLVVEGEVEVDVGVQDQPVVGDHRHVRPVRRLDDRRRRGAVVRRHHQHVHPLGEEVLGLGVLHRLVVVGRLHEDAGAELRAALDEQVPVALPALLAQGVEREADGDLPVGTGAGAGTVAAARRGEGHGEGRGRQQQDLPAQASHDAADYGLAGQASTGAAARQPRAAERVR